MTLDLTIAGGPIWLSRSRVNTESRDYGTFSASSMQALLKRIVDGDPESYWHSALALDSTTEQIDVTVQTKEALASKDVDFVALQNFNFKRFKVEYKSGGGSYIIVPGTDYTASDFSGTDLVLNPTLFSADTFRITAYSTQGGPDYKRLGGFYACQGAVQLVTGGMTRLDRRDDEAVRERRLGSNKISREYTLHSGASYEHWAAAVQLDLVSQAERDSLRTIKRVGSPFVFMPRPYERKRDIFTVHQTSTWAERLYSTFTGAGYTINADYREVSEL